VNLQTDNANCNQCGRACPLGSGCFAGQCLSADGGSVDAGPGDSGTPPFDGGFFGDGGSSCGRFVGTTVGVYSSRDAGPLLGPGYSDLTPIGAGSLYALQSTSLYQYTFATDSWAAMASPPQSVAYFPTPAWVGSRLYAIHGGFVLAYDIPTNTWITLLTGQPATPQTGNTHDLSGNVYALATAGGILKYNIASNTLTTITPSISLGTYTEPTIVFDDCTGLLYIAPAWSGPTMYSVNPNTGATVALTSIPDTQTNDMFCADHSGHIFAGGNSSNAQFWVYTIATNSWAKMTQTAPFAAGSQGACTVGDDNYLYVTNGSGPPAPAARILLQ
jgi:hypothetical protein